MVDGYIKVQAARYNDFTHAWVKQADRVLRPDDGSISVVSAYTNLYDVLDALRATKLMEAYHLIWEYDFGVFTSRKYVSIHYHILYYERPGGRRHARRTLRREFVLQAHQSSKLLILSAFLRCNTPSVAAPTITTQARICTTCGAAAVNSNSTPAAKTRHAAQTALTCVSFMRRFRLFFMHDGP